MGFFNRIKFDIDLDAIEGYVANNLRLFISLTIGLIIFVGIIAISVFFIAVRGTEQTMVPEVRGKDLTEALLELQTKELYPRIQLRYSQSIHDKGKILEQEPAGGTIVKAGRRIRLVVSQGVVLDRVENYVGRNINEVRVDLQTLFASMDQPLLSLKEPFMYENSSADSGIILQQKPEPGTGISGPTVLQFVISRGPEQNVVRVPNLVGLSVAGVLEQINQSKIDFVFSLRPARENERAETVVAQEPPGQTMVRTDTPVSITVAAPVQLAGGEAYGLFRYVLSPNVYPLGVTLEALLPSGERRNLASVDYGGGEFTMPYRLPVGSVLIFSMLDRELFREEVRESVNTLSWDQL
jgi:beta-lactam-binding protein with PASTA domain